LVEDKRKFGGKEYKFQRAFHSRGAGYGGAKKYAKNKREKGYNVRIVEGKMGGRSRGGTEYRVYARKRR